MLINNRWLVMKAYLCFLILLSAFFLWTINISSHEETAEDTLLSEPDFYMEYYYTPPPQNGIYFEVGQEGYPEPDEVIQVTLRFINNGGFSLANGNLVITENNVVVYTAKEFGKTRPGKETEIIFAAMGSPDVQKYINKESGRGVKHIHVATDFDVVHLDESLNITEVLGHLSRELEFDIPIGYRNVPDQSDEIDPKDIQIKETQQFTMVGRLETVSKDGSDNPDEKKNGSNWIGTGIIFLLIGAGIILFLRIRRKGALK